MKTDNNNAFQERVTEGLNIAFDSVIKSRKAYFDENPEKRPTSAKRIISSNVRNNAAISGGANLVPGPWGMLVVVPELTLVLRNQIQMIYDIGAAKGKEEEITKELLIGIFLTAVGNGAGSLLTIQGSKVLVRRTALRTMQKLVALLGGKITQQAMKSMVGKWVPIVGAATLAAWTGYMTKHIGLKAETIFSLDIQNDPSIIDTETGATLEN